MIGNKIENIEIVTFFMAACAIFFALSFSYYSQPTHDYIFYMQQWDAIIHGKNAWADKTNAYGPIHNVLALLYSININLPRLLFVSLWLISCIGIMAIIKQNKYLPEEYKYALYFTLLLNPLFWIFIVKFGTNDILMAFFVLVSIFFYKKQKDVVSGSLMAVAIAVKFIPLVMIPFLVFSKVRVRWNFAISLLLVLAAIFSISYMLWGGDLLHPFHMAGERSSKMLSIFRFLRGSVSPLRLFVAQPNLDWMSIYLCIGIILSFLYIHIKYNFENILSSITALTLLLMFFKVGHHQFYITLVMLFILWIGLDYRRIYNAGFSLLPVFTFILWISFMSFLYLLTNEYVGTGWKIGWREIIGLPTFLVSGWLAISLIKYSFRLADQNN